MELQTEPLEMLEQLLCPAFLVKNSIIAQANRAALDRQLKIGEPIAELLCVGQQEYAAFTEGRLCLSLVIDNVTYNASVVKLEQWDLFYIESDYEASELRAFALVAQCLREPLANALNCADDISAEDIQQSPELTRQLKKINRNLYQIHRAICNMSDVAQYSQQRSSRIENRNIVGIIEEIMHKTMPMVSESNHTLEYHGPTQAILGYVDSEKIERAVLNLISNAIKYSPKGSTITAALHQGKDKLYFSVQNNIHDYAVNSYNNVYARFLREPGLDNQNTGIGLGVTMVRNAAIAHGGTLLFEQPDGHSVRFTMSIAIRRKSGNHVHSPVLFPIDYAGGYDHMLVELSDSLPPELFE